MSDFVIVEQHTLTSFEIVPSDGQTYTLDEAATQADVYPDLLRYYCRAGLLGTERVKSEQVLIFDDEALYELRRIEHYRRHHGVNLRALPLVFGLLREIESLRAELRFLRDP